jgi:hypothetical protein
MANTPDPPIDIAHWHQHPHSTPRPHTKRTRGRTRGRHNKRLHRVLTHLTAAVESTAATTANPYPIDLEPHEATYKAHESAAYIVSPPGGCHVRVIAPVPQVAVPAEGCGKWLAVDEAGLRMRWRLLKGGFADLEAWEIWRFTRSIDRERPTNT